MTTRNTFRVAIRKFDPFESAIPKAWQSFEAVEQSGLILEAEPYDLHPLHELLFEQNALARGDVDVGFLPTDWLASAYDQQALFDLAPLIRANPPADYPTGWTNSVLRMQRFGDQVLGMPYHDGPECLIYRSDLFNDRGEQSRYKAKYGVDLRPPRTWDEFHRIAQFFTRPEQGLYGTVFAAFPDGHNTVYDFCLQLWTRGGELFDSANRLHLNTPEAAEALSFYRAILNDKTAIHPRANDMDSVKSGLAFAAGEVAMMINWFGFAAMAETIPDSKVKGKVAIDVLPHADHAPSASLNVYWVLGIGAGSPHAAVAYRFLRHCASAAIDKQLTLEGGIGCRKTTWEDSDVNRIIPFYHLMEKLHTTARELPRLANWTDLAARIDELMMTTIQSDRPTAEIAAEIQAKVDKTKG